MKYNNYATYSIKRGHRTKYFVPYRGMRREICKTQFLHYFKISKFVVESVAKTKADAAMSNPLSPMKSPKKQAASNTTQISKSIHIPPPQVTTCLHAEAKVAETTEKCQNPQSWQVLNVPERYASGMSVPEAGPFTPLPFTPLPFTTLPFTTQASKVQPFAGF